MAWLSLASKCLKYNQPHEAYMLLFTAKDLVLNHNIKNCSDIYERILSQCLRAFNYSTVVGKRIFLSIMHNKALDFINELELATNFIDAASTNGYGKKDYAKYLENIEVFRKKII